MCPNIRNTKSTPAQRRQEIAEWPRTLLYRFTESAYDIAKTASACVLIEAKVYREFGSYLPLLVCPILIIETRDSEMFLKSVADLTRKVPETSSNRNVTINLEAFPDRTAPVLLLDKLSKRQSIGYEAHDRTALKATPVFVWKETDPDKMIFLINKFAFEAATDQKIRSDKATTAAWREVNSLRRQLEESNETVFAISKTLRGTNQYVPHVASLLAPTPDVLEIDNPHRVTTIEQMIPWPSRGLAGIDLLFSWNQPTGTDEIEIELRSGDTSETLRRWTLAYAVAVGWVHLPLDVTLHEEHTFLILKIVCGGTLNDRPKPQLTISNNTRYEGLDVVLDGTAVDGKSLAFRVWQAPPGLPLPYNSLGGRSANPISASRPFVMPAHWNLTQYEPLHPLKAALIEAPDLVSVADRVLGLHPLADGIAAVRIPGLLIDRASRIMADVEVANPNGPCVEFAMLAVKQGQKLTEFPTDNGSFPEFYIFSGWHAVAPNGRGIVDLWRNDDRPGNYDVVLATRTLNKAPTTYAWARWSEFRVEWRPAIGRPVDSSGDTLSDLSMLAAIRRVRESRIRRAKHFKRQGTPLVTLIAPIHRPNDLDHLIQQLGCQQYVALEIIIVLHTPDITREDVSAACRRNGTADTRVSRIIEAGSVPNLGSCLNLGVSNSDGEIVMKIDADDYYGREYVGDMVAAYLESGSDIVGKSEWFVYFKDDDELTLFKSEPRFSFSQQVAGGTLTIGRHVFEKVAFRENIKSGSDKCFQLDAAAQGYRIWSADPFNYIHVRSSDPKRHTWQSSSDVFRPKDYSEYGGRSGFWRAVV